ncbi:cathepsin propeptide inhibitor domain (I29) domain-containing protein [Phthorimaea operculella]|nr:cathepsin propeptide inhibitor domain (I29) domain-containing protein [Phthorimaea operculella]
MKLLVFLCFVSLAAISNAVNINGKPYYDLRDAEKIFEEFQAKYNKVYKDEEDKQIHFESFKKALEDINRLNSDPEQATAVFDINFMTDFTPEQIKALTGYVHFKPEPYLF